MEFEVYNKGQLRVSDFNDNQKFYYKPEVDKFLESLRCTFSDYRSKGEGRKEPDKGKPLMTEERLCELTTTKICDGLNYCLKCWTPKIKEFEY